MTPLQIEFPKFVADQLLTSSNLNELFGYLDEQNRLTRTNLIGIGIVCGLHVQVNPQKTAVSITRGCGVTSEGYLIAVNSNEYSQYKNYKVDTAKNYDNFYKIVGAEKVPMDVWELKKPGVEADLINIDAQFLKNKVILLFVELKEEENKNCDPNSCDDKGINVTVSFLPMAVDAEDAKLLLGATGKSFGANTFVALPEMRMKRWNVPQTKPVTTADILTAYLQVLDKNFIDDTAGKLTAVYNLFGALVAPGVATNPFAGLSAKFSFLYNGGISTQQLIHMQYYYDLFSDLLQAYQEFRKAGTHVLSTCCPDSSLFPRHLLLGEAIPSVSNGILPYRHYFIYSPLFNQQDTLGELASLFRRLVLLTQDFFLPSIQGTNTREDDFLRITPSMLWDVPLSEKAIPYYYRANSGVQPLYLSWNYRKTVLNDASRNLSYHARQYNSADDFVRNPLSYDLEPYNFLRIEGIVGKPYVHVLSQVKSSIAKNRLPVDIIALSTDTANKLTNAAIGINKQDAANAMEMLCHFQDLESMYEAMSREILCMLCKELQYYYAFTYAAVNKILKSSIDAGEASQVDLFDQCSRGYKLKNNSLGMVIEFLHRRGFTDETLTLENFLQSVGINVQDIDNNDIPDGLTGQATTLYLTLLNFFKIPLGIIRLSGLLTADLAEFDAKAYCDATEKIGEYAKSIKALFAIFTGSKEATDTNTPNADTIVGGANVVGGASGTVTQPVNRANRINLTTGNNAMLASVAGSGNAMLRILAAILTIEDFFDHLDVLIYNCKCSALSSLKKDYLRRYAMLTRLRQFGYFNQLHPGMQHKAGVPMGGTFIIVYHAPKRGSNSLFNNLSPLRENKKDLFTDRLSMASFSAAAFGSNKKDAIAAGFVLDTSNKFIAGATVTIKQTNESTTTNPKGRFMLKSSTVPYTIVVEADGYQPAELSRNDTDDAIFVQLEEAKSDLLQDLQPGMVIADFYLPYRCCSDCPPITYVVNETTTPPPPPNKGPVANAGPDKEITLPKANEQLDGSASTDADGTITFYQWAKLSGPSSFNFATPNSAITGVNDLEEGVYVFELTVTDNSGAIARDSMQLKVNAAPPPENKPPIANAGDDRTIPLSFVTVTADTLDGTKSKDEDGEIVDQQWSKLSGPPATISSPNLLTTTVSLFEEGVYIFGLTVKDNSGLTDSSKVTLTVVRANLPPIADAGDNATVTLTPNNNGFVLDGSRSKDPEGGVLSYQWKFEGGASPAAIANPDAEKTTVTVEKPGEYKFSLLVTDNGGAQDLATVVVNVMITDEVREKRCGPLPELISSFNKISDNTDEATFKRFTEAYPHNEDVQSFFKELSILEDSPIDKQVDLFMRTAIHRRLAKWIEELDSSIISNPERKDLRMLALRLYRILVQLSMYIVCIQKPDFDQGRIPMNRFLAVVNSNAAQWATPDRNSSFSASEIKLIKTIGLDMKKESDRTQENGEAEIKVRYLKQLGVIIDIINTIPSN
jgi:hypothetical protein